MHMALHPKIFSRFRKKSKLKQDIQLRVLKRLDRLLKKGYPLIEALETMVWEHQLVQPVSTIIRSLKNGEAVDTAFEKAMFHPTITSHLYFVRLNGDLQTNIQNSIEMFSTRIQHMKKFKQVMQYPLFLLVIFFSLTLFIKHSILPSFMNLVQSSKEASSSIKLAVQIIDLLSSIVTIFFIGVIFIWTVWTFYKKKLSIEMQIRLYNTIPIYRSIIRLQTSFHFATHMSTLFKAGLTIKEVLVQMERHHKLPIIAYYSHYMKAHFNKGLPVSSFITQLSMLDKQLATILQNNENSQTLQRDLNTYAAVLLEELQNKTMKMITLIQPFLFIFIALFIIFIYAILMWPMFQLINTM